MRAGNGLRRRGFLQSSCLGIAAIGLGDTLLNVSSIRSAYAQGPKDTKELVYAGYGGVYEQGVRQAWFSPFHNQTGVDVAITTGSYDMAKMAAMVKSGHTQWDVVDTQGTTFGQLVAAELLEKLDLSVVPTSELANPAYISPYGVANYVFSHNILWNTKEVKGAPTSWADVWDVKRFPGKRGFQKVPWLALEIALVADGVPVDKLYPLDVDRAFRSLDRIRPYAVFQDLNSLTNLFAQQEVVIGDLNLARTKQLMKDGAPLQYTWNQAILDTERLGILKGAPNVANALKMIEFALQPEQQLKVLDILGYSPTVKGALARISSEQAKDLPGTPETLASSFFLDGLWWGQNGAKVGRRFEEWLL
jgi:putative spermidine/putrescine transport system substrate-binding protein